MKRKGRLVVNQKVGESNANSGEDSYWNHVSNHGKRMADGTIMENPLANPDVLSDDSANSIWGHGTPPELAELIIERFMGLDGNFPILSKRENEVLKLYTATGDMNLVCKEAKLSRGAVLTKLARIRSKFKRLMPAVSSRFSK